MLGLVLSCNIESDWPIPGENACPMIPGDAMNTYTLLN